MAALPSSSTMIGLVWRWKDGTESVVMECIPVLVLTNR